MRGLLGIAALIYIGSCCDILEEAVVLNCAAPLVSYVPNSRLALIPALSDIDRLCINHAKYLVCTAGVSPGCRSKVASNTEQMYDLMCEEGYRTLAREERDCLIDLERDPTLGECFVNRTNSLRDENFSSAASSYECSVIQAFVDCLLDRPKDGCGEAVKVQVSLLSLLSTRDGTQCKLVTNSTRSRPMEKLEICDPSGHCSCRLPGYFYDTSSRKCLDVDECLSLPCSQKCVNSPGSFQCFCELQYYHLSTDNRTCVRNDDDALWLFFAHGQSIWNISSDGRTFQLQRAGLQKTAMIDVDLMERRLYYADIGANSIERMNIEGTFPQAVQRMEVEGLEGIAVDWLGRNLYSLRRADILVQALDGRFRRTVYKDVMRLPRAIALHPHKGQMFVSDWSSSAFIAVANMDGSNFKKIITDRITWPNAIAVDIHADRLYWADAFLDVIEVANLDGTGRRAIITDSGSVPHIFGMAVADDYLYWTDWTYRGLLRAHKLTGDNITVLAQTALLPYSLKVFHPSIQPAEPSPCSERGCDQLCLLGPGGTAKCACGEGFELQNDAKSCKSNCSSAEIECGGSDPKCISKIYLCDGVAHCSNRADESRCPPRFCLPGQFQCHDNTKCVPPGGLCDQKMDCDDRSDEIYCKSEHMFRKYSL